MSGLPVLPAAAQPALLDRAPCPERFQGRWAAVWTSTPWGGLAYPGHAPDLPMDSQQEQRLYRLNGVIVRWYEPDAADALADLLHQGGLVHTPNAVTSPWGRLLNACPDSITDDRPLTRWARCAHRMLDHGASLNQVAYPWLAGERKPAVVRSVCDDEEITFQPPAQPRFRTVPGSSATTMVVGTTGSGKSTMLRALLRQVLHHPCTTPLAQAAGNGNAILAHWLLEQGADPLWASPSCHPAGFPDRAASKPVPYTEARWALPFMIAEWSQQPDLAAVLEARALARAEAWHLRQDRSLAPVTVPAPDPRRRL